MNIKVKYATSLTDKIFGLILSRNKPPLFFCTKFGIHTFFLKYSIDVLVLNSNFEVVILKKNLQPFSFFFYNPKYCYVLELVSGFIDKAKIKVGDKINID